MRVRTGFVATVVAALVAAALAGCSNQSSLRKTPVSLDEKDKGHTITVDRGQSIIVVLHNTWWRFAPSQDSKVLTADEPSIGIVSRCLPVRPGMGCGTVTGTFSTVGTGVVELTAHRDNCGEARTCQPGEATYSVTISVR